MKIKKIEGNIKLDSIKSWVNGSVANKKKTLMLIRIKIKSSIRKIFVNKSGATADRATEADDMQVNDHAWKLSNGVASLRWTKMRSDVIS